MNIGDPVWFAHHQRHRSVRRYGRLHSFSADGTLARVVGHDGTWVHILDVDRLHYDWPTQEGRHGTWRPHHHQSLVAD